MLVGKPAVLVPSPNVAEDHQTKNALALVEADAAIMVKDKVAKDDMITTALALLENKEEQQNLSSNLLSLAKPEAREIIANEIMNLT